MTDPTARTTPDAEARRPAMSLTSTVLGTPDPRRLAAFYSRLLGWPVRTDEPDWVTLRAPSGAGLAFQLETEHVRPVWPGGPGDQLMQVHLDIEVDDLAAGCAFAEACGAELAAFQPQDDVRVHLDPDGHPFCLWSDPAP
jgi:catechol 2,3-dioxygenase-like lactoylglutathione lyase family enzyme